jgi:hypothetical protein
LFISIKFDLRTTRKMKGFLLTLSVDDVRSFTFSHLVTHLTPLPSLCYSMSFSFVNLSSISPVIKTAFFYDICATLFVFCLSVAFNNSSFYDPYWSIIPIPLAFYYSFHPQASVCYFFAAFMFKPSKKRSNLFVYFYLTLLIEICLN